MILVTTSVRAWFGRDQVLQPRASARSDEPLPASSYVCRGGYSGHFIGVVTRPYEGPARHIRETRDCRACPPRSSNSAGGR